MADVPNTAPPAIQAIAEINGVPTTLHIQAFSDRYLVCVSQVNKLGTIVAAKAEKTREGGPLAYDVRTLLGKRDDELLEVLARRLIADIAAKQGTGRALLLTIALGPEAGADGAALKQLYEFVAASAPW